jgi:hypothetical protein
LATVPSPNSVPAAVCSKVLSGVVMLLPLLTSTTT